MKTNKQNKKTNIIANAKDFITSTFNDPMEILVTLILSTFLFFIMSLSALGQACFQSSFGGSSLEEMQSVLETSEGNMVFAGRTISGGSKEMIYVVQTDATGNLMWSKTYGDLNSSEMASSIIEGNNGSLILTGYTYSHGNTTDADITLVKLDKYGKLQWSKVYPGLFNEFGAEVTTTHDGGYYITGSTYSSGAGLTDIILIKTDSNGNMLWNKTYGGNGLDNASSIKTTADGGAIITGFTMSKGAGNKDAIIIRTDNLGDTLWTRTFGTSYADQAWGICISPNGGYAIAGDSKSFGNGDDDIYIVRIDDNGNKLWEKAYGTNESEKATDIKALADGSFILTGTYGAWNSNSNNALLIKLDQSGNISWANRYTGNGYSQGNSVFPTTDQGYVLAGNTQVGNSYDGILIKTNENGESWCNQQNLTLNDITGTSIQSSGLVTGPGGFQHTNVSFTSNDLMPGILSFCYSCDLPSPEFSYIDSGLNVSFTELSTGEQSYLWDMGDGSTSANANPNHSYNSYSTYQVCLSVENICGSDSICHNIEIQSTNTSIGEYAKSNNISIYPLPAQNNIHVDINTDGHSANATYEISVFDMTGRTVMQQNNLRPGNNKINISSLTAGKYFYILSHGDVQVDNGVIIKNK